MKPLTHDRIEGALRRIMSGHAPMRIPVDNADVDVVLSQCIDLLDERDALKAEIAALNAQAAEYDDKYRETVDALRERAEKAEAAVEYQRSAITAAVAGENTAMAQVAALAVVLDSGPKAFHEPSDAGLECICARCEFVRRSLAALADTAKTAAEHDARIRKEARRAALEEARVSLKALDPEDFQFMPFTVADDCLKALAASEPEGGSCPKCGGSGWVDCSEVGQPDSECDCRMLKKPEGE